MEINQIFFHLTYAFLLITSLTRLTPFARCLQFLVVLSLGSYLTLVEQSEFTWQIWSSCVVLFHLFFWKNYSSRESKYESNEIEIWNEFFEDSSEEDFQIFMNCSQWRSFSFNGNIVSDKDYFVLSYNEEASSWDKLSVGESYSISKGSLKLFVDRNQLREQNSLIESAVLHILTTNRTNRMAS